MSSQRIQPDQFSRTVFGIFDEYGQSVMSGIRKEVDKTARELVKETKETAPKKSIKGRPAGTYANHITSKVTLNSESKYARTWYVRPPEYRLTHLLNNGHALRQGGHWGGTQFLTKATQSHSELFETRIKKVIQNAGR